MVERDANEGRPNVTKSFEELSSEFDSATTDVKLFVDKAIAADPANQLRTRQAEWNVRGMSYHCAALLKHYKEFAGGVSGRATTIMDQNRGEPPVMIIMYSPECQQIMFEFYALVNLARISLDRLVHVVAPVFKTPSKGLPNSINEFWGRTDCPLYLLLEDLPIVSYLIDVRDCLVHFRSFGTHDNALVLLEGQVEPDSDAVNHFTKSMFRAVFRPVGTQGVAVNVFLPDKIFVREGSNKKLASFTFENGINLLSQSREFLRMIADTTSAALSLLVEPGKPTYTYTKGSPARK
jgi:hypothetical protein